MTDAISPLPDLAKRPRALVRRTSPNLADGLVMHGERPSIDHRLATLQWEIYVALLEQHGWATVEVPEAPDCADSVFVEDTMVVLGSLAVIARPAAPSRAGEIGAAEATVSSLGLATVRIQAPGTLDGGDVLKVGRTVYVGRTARTNGEGIRQLRAIAAPLGYTVVAVPITNVLHLKSAVTALPDGTVIGWPPAVDAPSVFPSFLPMPEESGAHVVLLGGDRLLVAADAVRSIELLADLGYTPVPVDIGEFVKLDGCVTCLSVRIRDF